MYFPRGGGSIKGESKPAEIVWSSVYIQDSAPACRYWSGNSGHITTGGDAVPLELDAAAMAEHECHIAWCQPGPVDGSPQSQSHSDGVCSIGAASR